MVRPSIKSYLYFSLLMGSSPSFGSSIYDLSPYSGSLSLRLRIYFLNLATHTNSLVRSTKSTWSPEGSHSLKA